MNKYKVIYDDGDVEELDLHKEKWRKLSTSESNVETVLVTFNDCAPDYAADVLKIYSTRTKSPDW